MKRITAKITTNGDANKQNNPHSGQDWVYNSSNNNNNNNK